MPQLVIYFSKNHINCIENFINKDTVININYNIINYNIIYYKYNILYY